MTSASTGPSSQSPASRASTSTSVAESEPQSGADGGTALATSHGRTTIADTVVAKIAGIATREVSGVHALGGSASRAVGSLMQRIPGGRTNHSQGVSVEVGERQAAVDIELIAQYGLALADLAEDIRRNVISSVERMTGLQVTEVNIAVQDVHLESDDAQDGQNGPDDTSIDSDKAPRVQ